MKLKSELFYYIFFVCFIVYWELDTLLINSGIDYSLLSNLSFIIGGVSFAILWFLSKFTFSEIIKQIIFLIIILFVFIKSGMDNTGLLVLFPAIVGLKNVKIKDVVKIMFWTLSITFSIFLILCVIKVIPFATFVKVDAYGNSYNMITFGNQHGNTIYVIWFNILCSYIYSYFDKIKKINFLILIIISLILYFLLCSRTGIILSLLTILLVYYVKYKKHTISGKLKIFVDFILEYSYVIFYIIVFLIAAYLYDTQFYEILNNVVSSRIAEVRHYLVDVGFGWLPKKVIYYWICDNTQIKILVSYGMLFTCMYLALSVKTLKYLTKNSMTIEIVMMIMYLLYSYSEVAFFKPVSDFTMLFFSYALFRSYYQSKDGGVVDEKNPK